MSAPSSAAPTGPTNQSLRKNFSKLGIVLVFVLVRHADVSVYVATLTKSALVHSSSFQRQPGKLRKLTSSPCKRHEKEKLGLCTQ